MYYSNVLLHSKYGGRLVCGNSLDMQVMGIFKVYFYIFSHHCPKSYLNIKRNHILHGGKNRRVERLTDLAARLVEEYIIETYTCD